MNAQSKKKTISEQLLKTNIQSMIKKGNVLEDIEDIIPEVKSEYFSPIATRLQRKVLNKTLNKIHDLTNIKRIKKEPKNEKPKEKDVKPQLVTKIAILNDLPEHELKNIVDVKKIKKEPKNEKSKEKDVKPQLVTKIEILNDLPEDESKNLVDALWEPKDWKKMFDNIRSMRALIEAPVDTMGCHKCQDEKADRKTQRFQILVSLMLSSQTKDEVTHAAVERLLVHNLNPKVISQMETEVLEKIIHPVGFYKTKAKHLKLTSQILMDKYDSDIPPTSAELIKLPGVGPKMAHLCMSEAWGEITGIGVDVHVHRISNRLNWVPHTTKDPEKTRVALEAWLPRSMWREVNHALVGFGQTVCLPVRPKCNFCLNKDICPSAFKDNEKPQSSKKSK